MASDNKPHIEIAYAPTGAAYTPWKPFWTAARWLSVNPRWTLGPTANIVGPPFGLFDGGTISLSGIPAGSAADYFIFAWGPGTNFDSCASFGIWCSVAGPFRTLTGGGGQPPVSLADSFTGVTIVGSTDCSAPARLREGLRCRGRPDRFPPTSPPPSRSTGRTTGPGAPSIPDGSSTRPGPAALGPGSPRPLATALSK